MISTETETRKCLGGCGRTLRSAEAVSRGYGSGCWRKIRRAARTADLSAWTPAQAEDARELIEDGGVVPTARPGVFRTVSRDGSAMHLTSAKFCGCERGLKAKPCYHGLAVTIVLAASAPAPHPVPAPEPVAVPAPRDLLAELEAMVEFELAHS